MDLYIEAFRLSRLDLREVGMRPPPTSSSKKSARTEREASAGKCALSCPKDPEMQGDHLLGALLKMGQKGETNRFKGRLGTECKCAGLWFLRVLFSPWASGTLN